MMSVQNSILVFSFGGVASKRFLLGVSPGKSLDEIRPSHSHMRMPPKTIDVKSKVVYLFGDPMNAVISFFNRRNYLHSRHGYASQSMRESRKDWAYQHCRKIQGDCSRFSAEWDLEDFLSHGEDLFKLEEHFDNWVNANVDYPILTIRYETLWNYLPEIFDYLQLPQSEIKNFPSNKKRSSNWQEEPEHVQQKLLKIYGKLHEKITRHEDVKII
jgi:hypothetical protein